MTTEYHKSPWCLYELQVARKRAAEGKLKILPYVLDEAVWPMLAAAGLAEFQARDCTRQEPEVAIAEIIRDLDRELRAGPQTAGLSDANFGSTTGRLPVGVALKEEERSSWATPWRPGSHRRQRGSAWVRLTDSRAAVCPVVR